MRHTILRLIIYEVIIIISFVSSHIKSCHRQNISFFQALLCRDGTIGTGMNCQCDDDGDCKLLMKRSFLPSPNSLDVSRQQELCDVEFSNLIEESFANFTFFTAHAGYPQGCSNSNCHSPSIGKYLRYTSLLEYYQLKKDKTSLFDIKFPTGFRWSRGISSCELIDGWQCLFKNMSDRNHLYSKSNEKSVHLLHDESVKWYSEILNYRENRPDHAVQLIIYGKLLVMLSRPSSLVVRFLGDHLTSTHASYHAYMADSGLIEEVSESDEPTFSHHTHHHFIPEPCSQTHEFANMSPSMHKSLCRTFSVSMHVRQGDSCDFVLDVSVEVITNYLRGELEQRPCFSIDVYMKKLYLLRMMYGVHRVYLATDSQDMIDRTHKHTEYHWIYLDINRTFLEKRFGWIDDRKDSDNENISFSAVADLMLMRRGDIFLGAFTSHFSKLAYYMMVGTRMRLPPFISLDYPLSCDTIDSCSTTDLELRNFTIEDIVSRAPECQRTIKGKLRGSVEAGDDPCGIYS